MPYIKKLVMKGFKSFPTETEVPFQNSMNVVVGPNGSGKCLTGDSLVTLSGGSQVPIKKLKNNKRRVISLNKKLKLEEAEITEFFEREVERLLKIKLISGKEIKLTPEHPLLTLKGWVPAQDLKTGIRIATPKKNKRNLSDIHWDKIVSIKILKGKFKVYDICVPKDHNFIANNIFVHNSNIADAICFVLGRLSIKSIRAAKSANLIFAGTKQHKSAGIASVKLIFDNSDKGFFLAQKEITIERIVKNSGQSIYKINNETKTRQEVLELLAQAGIDPHGFNIVLQGEITDLVKASPEERRKIIEQVAGISVYEIRKQRSLKELEKTDEKLKEVAAILRERTSYLKNLEKERQQALKFKQLEKTVRQCKASIINKKINEKQKELIKVEEEIAGKDKIKQKIKSKIEEMQKQISILEENIDDINKKIQASTGIEQEKLYSQLTELRESLAGLEVHKQNSERKLEETLSRRQRADKDVKEFQAQIRELRKKSPSQAKKQEQLQQKKQDFGALEAEKKKFYSIKSKLDAIKQRIDDKKSMLLKNENETSLILRQADELQLRFKSIGQARQNLISLKKELNEKENKLESQEKEKLSLEKQTSVSESEIDGLDKIKKQVSKLDICPLCKSKITSEHIKHVYQDCDEKIEYNTSILTKSKTRLSSLNQEIAILKPDLSRIKESISFTDIEIIKLENLEQKTHAIKRLKKEEEELSSQLKQLQQEKQNLENLAIKFKDVESKYEQTLLEIEEISARTEENLDLELELKERDLERTKLILKQGFRDEEELEEELKEIEKEIQEKSELLEQREAQEKQLQAKYQKLFESRTDMQNKIHQLNQDSLKEQHSLQLNENDLNNLKIDKARIDAETENLSVDLEAYKSEQLIQASIEILQSKLTKAESTLALIGSVNLRALEVYDEIKKEYDEVADKANNLVKEKEEILKIIEEIDKKKIRTFNRTLNAINELFTRNFSQLSPKGQVFLDVQNKEDLFEGGLNIIVKVGKGKYFDVTSLSGGEQTLVSLSLLFSIQEYKPYCFYIFDEVDAALDKRNSERLAVLIKKYMKTGQYIIITHNDAIITESTLLYGVSMQDGISKILSLEV